MEEQQNQTEQQNKIKEQNQATKQEKAEQQISQKDNSNVKKEFWRTCKFVLFSISAGIIQILSYELLSNFVFKDASINQYEGSYYGWSYFIALTLSVLWNFTINRKFTFKSAKNVPVAMLLVLAFYCVFTPLSIWWGIALVKAGWNDTIVLLLTMLINLITEFLWTRFVVYRKSIDTAKPKNDKKSNKNM